MKHILILLISFFNITALLAQQVSGTVADENGETIIGAIVSWEDNPAIGTTTDANGQFTIERIDTLETRHLMVRFVGYDPVVVPIEPHESVVAIQISGITNLEEINVEARRSGNFLSTLNPRNIETVGEGELRKAPCCNLSESFETNAAVDVNFTDAVTGAKEIEMLGLRGIYTQLMIENRPALYGLATAYGLELIPGTWLESIQISKGTSAVTNGPRSVVGQINIELQKPFKGPPLFVNLFANHQGRTELNLQFNQKINKRLSTGLLLHGDYFGGEFDHNHDGFIDNPKRRQLNGVSRWHYQGDKFESQFSLHGVIDERDGGQTAGHHGGGNEALYQFEVGNRRAEAVFKLGYIGFPQVYRSIGFQASATLHRLTGNFGDLTGGNPTSRRQYDGTQRSIYTNLIYETILFNTFHKVRTGASWQFDEYRETFNDAPLNRQDNAPGAFFEYSWDWFKRSNTEEGAIPDLTLIAAFRADYLNGQGILPVPRLNIKYNFTPKSVLRASAGRGWRTANALAENFAYMPGSREFMVLENLRPEIAWNYGINFTQRFYLGTQEGSFNVDFYRSDFENQVVVDLDSDSTQVRFYNLNGQSFSNSFIAMWTQEVAKGLELKLAYKYNDVRTTFGSSLESKPLLPVHRGLFTAYYTTPDKGWEFNVIAHLTGAQRLPAVQGSTDGLPNYRLERRSPAYVTLSAQITKNFKNGLEIYIGAENLTNYRQPQPIMGADNVFNTDPAAPRFDATSVYGPIMGVMAYAGLRFTMNAGFGQKESVILTTARCGMCKDAIENAVLELPGIKSVSLCLEDKKFTVKYSPKKVSLQQIREKIAATGYNADGVMRDEKVYEELPGCCKE